MAHRGDTIENPLTGERMTFLETARDTDGELLRVEYVAPPRSKGPTEHVQPLQEERWEVVSGVMGVRLGARLHRGWQANGGTEPEFEKAWPRLKERLLIDKAVAFERERYEIAFKA